MKWSVDTAENPLRILEAAEAARRHKQTEQSWACYGPASQICQSMPRDVWGGANLSEEVWRHLKDSHSCQSAKNEGHPQALCCCPGRLQRIASQHGPQQSPVASHTYLSQDGRVP